MTRWSGFKLRRQPGSLFSRLEKGPLGYAEAAGWLAQRLLWVDGWFTSASQDALQVTLATAEVEWQAKALRFCYARPDLGQLPQAAGQILVIPASPRVGKAAQIDWLHLYLEGCWYRWTGSKGMAVGPDLVERLTIQREALKPEGGRALLAFLAETCVQELAVDVESDELFKRHLGVLRPLAAAAEPAPGSSVAEEETEPRVELLPTMVGSPQEPIALSIDRLIEVDSESVFVRAWLWDAEGIIRRLELMPPEGPGTDVLDLLSRTQRTDVADLLQPGFGDRAQGKHGRIGWLRVPPPVERHRRYRFELRLATGECLRVGAPRLLEDEFTCRDEVLRCLPEELFLDVDLLAREIHPALARLQPRCRERAGVSRTFEFGSPPASPRISVIIPLWQRLDLIEHQLAQLADDPALEESEILYVLDSPELELTFEKAAFHLSRLYQVPLRGVVLAQNTAYAGATNLGATAARGRLLVLLHSDVFPERPGWLRKLAEFYDSRDRIGVLGTKLLFEDTSLQHAGLGFTQELYPDRRWWPLEEFKGLPRTLPQANVTRRVAAVSGACLMIDRELFTRLGGFREAYVAGDVEDADLCLRCLEEGKENWYLPEVELVHFERQSRLIEVGWQRNQWSELYNRWLFDRTWGDRLAELGESDPSIPSP